MCVKCAVYARARPCVAHMGVRRVSVWTGRERRVAFRVATAWIWRLKQVAASAPSAAPSHARGKIASYPDASKQRGAVCSRACVRAYGPCGQMTGVCDAVAGAFNLRAGTRWNTHIAPTACAASKRRAHCHHYGEQGTGTATARTPSATLRAQWAGQEHTRKRVVGGDPPPLLAAAHRTSARCFTTLSEAAQRQSAYPSFRGAWGHARALDQCVSGVAGKRV